MLNESFISLTDVSKRYSESGFSGVADLNLDISKGKIVAIVGESGSGKSTLLKLIYGLLDPDTGSVFFRGEKIAGPTEKLLPGHDRMKMVTQDFSLNTYAKVYENISSMLSNSDLKAKRERTEAAMRLLRIDHLGGKRAVDLSGGEQQRVAIARAMITGPEVLLLDEPFSQVDTILRDQLRGDLARLCRETGTTIILVSHDPVDGLSLADHMMVLQNGKLVEQGEPVKLYNAPEKAYTARLLANSTILTSEQALMLDIDSNGKNVGIHPEWVRIRYGRGEADCLVTDRSYRGPFTELMIAKNGVSLRARTQNEDSNKGAEYVGAIVTKWVSFL